MAWQGHHRKLHHTICTLSTSRRDLAVSRHHMGLIRSPYKGITRCCITPYVLQGTIWPYKGIREDCITPQTLQVLQGMMCPYKGIKGDCITRHVLHVRQGMLWPYKGTTGNSICPDMGPSCMSSLIRPYKSLHRGLHHTTCECQVVLAWCGLISIE